LYALIDEIPYNDYPKCEKIGDFHLDSNLFKSLAL